MNILFPSTAFEPNEIDYSWQEEYSVAKNILTTHLYDRETKKFSRSLKRSNARQKIIYHGWMFNEKQYTYLYNQLADLNYELINDPKQYISCHHFIGWYDCIKDFTPKSIIVNNNTGSLVESILKFRKENSCDIFIKDYVSSLKHAWDTACFIPHSATAIEIAKVIMNFSGYKDEYGGIEGGIVLRKFEQLEKLCNHPRSNMPLSIEYRSFVFNGKIISTSPYWEYGEYKIDPPLDFIQNIADRVFIVTKSSLFTVDCALKKDGSWICIEVGDGQVSALPDRANKKEFYSNLLKE